jgi:tetratricopeptide (TPR) repeat protein
MRTPVTVPLLLLCLSAGACGSGDNQALGSTTNEEALLAYDSAYVLERERVREEDLRAAEALYKRATELDPGFVLAYAGLARVNAGMVHFMYDPTTERRTMAREAAEKALELQPDMGETHHAMGVYWYWSEKDYDRAASELQLAAASLPESAEILETAAYVERRRGQFERGMQYLERAAQLDPQSAAIQTNLGDTHEAFGHYDQALAAYRAAQQIQPDGHFEVARSLILMRRDGNTDSLRAALAQLPAGFDPDGLMTLARFQLAQVERNMGDALAALSSSQQQIIEGQTTYLPLSLLAAQAHQVAGHAAPARAAFDSARAVLEPAAAAAGSGTDAARVYAALASAYAGLGMSTEAAQAAQRAMVLMPPERDALNAQDIARQAAAVFADIGQPERAVALLQAQLNGPVFGYSRRYLTMDPTWDRIRSNAAFQALTTGG